MTVAPPSPVLVVGSGLIGCSVGLALRQAGGDVLVSDQEPDRLTLAVELGAGRADDGTPPELVLVAVPPLATAAAVAAALRRYPNSTVMDVASTKTNVVLQVETLNIDTSNYLPSHPIAGRERAGPAAARPDLFQGRRWVLTPTSHTSDGALAAGTALVRAAGAEPALMSPAEHDELLARLSHAPQVVASALAASIADLPPDALAAAGQGLRDILRIAGSDPDLWAQIAVTNAVPLAQTLTELAADLSAVAAELATAAPTAQLPTLSGLLARGNRGVRALPGKHGGRAETFATVSVVLGDRPGELARLFADVSSAGVNVEDVSLEHAPGHPVGVAELMVRPDQAADLRAVLTRCGWTATG